jgi:phosphoenolpyruvate phosphomutase
MPGIKLVVNPDHATTNELVSLACATDALDGDVVISYGDLLFRSYILRDLLGSDNEIAIVVDSTPEPESNRTVRDFVVCSEPDDRGLFGRKVLLQEISDHVDGEPHGRWIGLLSARGDGVKILRDVVDELRTRPDFAQLDVPALLNALVERGQPVEVQYVRGHWRGINDFDEFRSATDFAHAQQAIRVTPREAQG